MSSNSDQEFFADGMCEDIITVLSKVSGLSVIARNSSFAYKDTSKDIRDVGKHLGANFVLEGSVRRQGKIIRVTGQLIDALTGHHVWADRYDRKIEDVFELQDEMTREIVSALQISLTEGERARIWAGSTQSFAAWEKQIQAPRFNGTQIIRRCTED
jgi:TolB-like protein